MMGVGQKWFLNKVRSICLDNHSGRTLQPGLTARSPNCNSEVGRLSTILQDYGSLFARDILCLLPVAVRSYQTLSHA
jgi:hypothetical protein